MANEIEVTDDTKVSDLIGADVPEEKEAVEETKELDTEVEEETTDTEVDEQTRGTYEDAAELNKQLKAELEELKSADNNVFEENAILKQKLEDSKKLAAMANENKAIKEQLLNIKKDAILDSMVASGKIKPDLRDMFSKMPIDQIELYDEHTSKSRTILDEKNPTEPINTNMVEWRAKMNRSRIIS